MKGLTIANGGDQSKRRKLDFYPTPPEVTHALMKFLDLSHCNVYEPACGNGAMSEVLKAYGHNVVSSDIRETGYGEGGIDFLTTDKKHDAIITNPPFNISHEFILHAIQCADVVAMVLKCQYWHAKKRIDLFNHNAPAYVFAFNMAAGFWGWRCANNGCPLDSVDKRGCKYKI